MLEGQLSAPMAERTLTGLAVLIQSTQLKQAIQPYTLAGPWGRLLDGDEERFGTATVQAFETEGLIGTSAAAAVLAYRIEGKAPWRPLRAFDDGERLYIEFPPSIAQHQMPPLFALTESGELELVNYRVRDRIIIAERLLDRAELRLGSRKSDRVRIEKLEQ